MSPCRASDEAGREAAITHRSYGGRAALTMLSSTVVGQRLARSVPILLALMLASCSDPPNTEVFELSGQVTALSGAGSPIEGAVVRFTSDTRRVAETTTDGSGRYRMRVSTDHAFGQVRAEAADFTPGETTVYFDAPRRRIDLALRPIGDG